MTTAPVLISRVLRIAAWGSVVALALLSLLPSGSIARTSMGGHAEHVIAYAIAAALLCWGYSGSAGQTRIVAALLAYAAILETLQQFSPGRTSQLRDFAFSAAGVLIGAALAWALRVGALHRSG